MKSPKEQLLFRLAELMLEKEQTSLLIDDLYEDEMISPFIRNIQIDSPFQQLIFEGVLSQHIKDESQYISFTIEAYFQHVLAKVLQSDKRYTNAESLMALLNQNKFKGLAGAVSNLLSFEVIKGNFVLLTEIIRLSDEEVELLDLWIAPVIQSLKVFGIDKTIQEILKDQNENSWDVLFIVGDSLQKLQMHDLRKSFFTQLMPLNEMNNKMGVLIGLYAISIFEKEDSVFYLNKLQANISLFEEDKDILDAMAHNEEKFGYYQKALENYEKCLELRIKKFGATHAYIANTYNSIGYVLSKMASHTRALTYFEKCLEIRLSVFGEQHIDVAIAYNNIGFNACETQQFENALIYYEKSLSIFLKCVGSEHSEVANTFNNIGLVWLRKNDPDSALKYYENCLSIQIKTLTIDHPLLAVTFENLGTAWKLKEDFNKALEYYKKCLAINMKVYGLESIEVANAYNEIGTILYSMGDFNNALNSFMKRLDIETKIYDLDNIVLSTSYINIANTHENLGDNDSALKYYQSCLELQLKVLGTENIDVAVTNSYIGSILISIGDFENGVSHFEASLSIYLSIFGAEHHEVYKTLKNIGFVYYEIEDYQNAIIQFEKALSLCPKTLEANPPETIELNFYTAVCKMNIENYSEAIDNLVTCFNLKQSGSFTFRVAQCYEALNDKEAALDSFIQSAEYNNEDLGIDHEKTIEAVNEALRLARELNMLEELPEWMKNFIQ
ncbi:MAG: tetratricopeptide repeat protein [Bacteroidota bacterium]|nr:tetratricopeptide repeat protein [Bacteroidota bacterium]